MHLNRKLRGGLVVFDAGLLLLKVKLLLLRMIFFQAIRTQDQETSSGTSCFALRFLLQLSRSLMNNWGMALVSCYIIHD